MDKKGRPTFSKKGVGYWSKDGIHDGLTGSGVAWCYDWGSAPAGKTPTDIEFVPMIWTGRNVNTVDLKKAKMSGKVLLGFNEPDSKDQANMTVGEALRLWPQLEAVGRRLGSPAATSGGDLKGRWVDQFMQGAKEKGYRVDFICAHYYSANYTNPEEATTELRNYLGNIYHRYDKPIWLTEFALSNWKSPATNQQQLAFIQEAVPMLEKLPYVERYAWFALPPYKGDSNSLANSNLSDDNATLNTKGIAYRDAK